jgi:hypothetical protein
MQACLLAVAVGLVMAQPDKTKLEVVDVRATYGLHGPTRRSADVVPGERLHFSYRLNGVRTDADGKIDVTLDFQLLNAKGKVFTKNSLPMRDVLPLGGNTLVGFAQGQLDREAAPGDYTLKVSISDNIAQETVGFERKIVCKKMTFAITELAFFFDSEGKWPGSNIGILGHSINFRLAAVGWDRAKPNLRLVMFAQALDKDGRELTPKPVRVEVASEDAKAIANAPGVGFHASMALNRAGDFQLRIIVLDEISDRKAEVTVPLKVLPP